MAWMRAMGARSVDYHEENVAKRADDHPGQALDYYGSRGETPLTWGGSGAHLVELEAEATVEAYRAVFGPGGARMPRTGAKLVTTRTPGIELVVSPHKSVAEPGVIGCAPRWSCGTPASAPAAWRRPQEPLLGRLEVAGRP
jgi:TrwC relaxase